VNNMANKGVSKMKVIYDADFGEIQLEEGVAVIDIITDIRSGNRCLCLDIDKTIPLNIATKLFQRFHQIDQDAEPEFIARALNDALNSELEIKAKTGNHEESEFRGALLYTANYNNDIHFNVDGLLWVFRGTGLYDIENDNDSVKHNITEDRVEYFIDDNLKGWLPIIRKEITP